MERVYSPKAGANEKKYRHYTVNSYVQSEITADKKKEFFYIGRDSFVIDALVHTFDGGYAAESADKAISILTKVLEKRSILPDLFLVDASAGTEQINRIHRFIAEHRVLATVPFMIEASLVNAKELHDLRTLSFVDEIIFMHRQADKLTAKLSFIKKIKDAENIKTLRQNIQSQPASAKPTLSSVAKRVFDIAVSGVVLVLLFPLFALIAIAIRIESKGPIFYIAKRAGRGYRVFNFFKFRTMEVNADKKVQQLSHLNQYNADATKGPVFFKVSNDPRITRVGAFLRNTSLDELPQFINVLRGDMSLVGNRPLPLYEAETLTTDNWAERFMAPAGITGLWQIKKRGQEDMSVEERIGLDITYANRNNFMYDLWIMANTPTALIQKSSV